MERLQVGIKGRRVSLILLAAFSLSGCFEGDAPRPKQVVPVKKDLPQKVVSIAPKEVKNDPVVDHWTENGYQGLDGKMCTTWWDLGGVTPLQFFQIVMASVKEQWPHAGFSQKDAATARYQIPITTNAFGEVRDAEVVLATTATEQGTLHVQFTATPRAEDLAEASKVAQQEAERLYLVTAHVAAPNLQADASPPDQTPSEIPARRYTPVWKDGLPDYGFANEVLGELKGTEFEYCCYGNRIGKAGEQTKSTPLNNSLGTVVYRSDYVFTCPSSLLNERNRLFVLDSDNKPIEKGPFFEGDSVLRIIPGRSIGVSQHAVSTPAVSRVPGIVPCLYRTFSFPPSLKDLQHNAEVNAEAKKLTILIHGWNPDDYPNKYDAKYSQPDGDNPWPHLRDALRGNLPSGWGLVMYDWSIDSATGPVLSDAAEANHWRLHPDGIRNGCQAAAIGTLHGRHLGELLRVQAPHLKSVHFIAHSAGAWVARGATTYLLSNSGLKSVQVQVTLLDPFMPKESGYPGARNWIGVSSMEQLAKLDSTEKRIVRLENYYVQDLTGSGTEQNFRWREQIAMLGTSSDVNFKLYPPAEDEYLGYRTHAGPIRFYTDSIIEKKSSYLDSVSKIGWPLSLARLTKSE